LKHKTSKRNLDIWISRTEKKEQKPLRIKMQKSVRKLGLLDKIDVRKLILLYIMNPKLQEDKLALEFLRISDVTC